MHQPNPDFRWYQTLGGNEAYRAIVEMGGESYGLVGMHPGRELMWRGVLVASDGTHSVTGWFPTREWARAWVEEQVAAEDAARRLGVDRGLPVER